jgi:hypothetical protein
VPVKAGEQAPPKVQDDTRLPRMMTSRPRARAQRNEKGVRVVASRLEEPDAGTETCASLAVWSGLSR